MKQLLTSLLALTLLVSACKKEQDIVDPDQIDTPTGTVTEVGEPEGAIAIKTIGPEGGTIMAADGNVTLTIPAGAVDKATPFSIQPITNYAPNGVGQAYRFAPDGMQFKTTLTLTYHYKETELTSADPDGLRVGYQKANGVWYGVTGLQVDKVKKQVTVPMTHFSDWSLLDAYHLVVWLPHTDPDEILYFGESVSLSVFEIADLGRDDLALRQQVLGERQIGKWSLSGGGTLKPEGDGRATYTAPMAPTTQNPVTVSVELTFPKSSVKLILVQQIMVGLGYIKVNFKGKTHYMTAVGLDEDDSNALISIGGGLPDAAFTMDASASGPGTFPFGPVDRQQGVSYADFGYKGELPYQSLAGWCSDSPILSVGSVVVDSYKKGRYVKGKFSGYLVGNNNDECDNSGPAISGVFHVRTLP